MRKSKSFKVAKEVKRYLKNNWELSDEDKRKLIWHAKNYCLKNGFKTLTWSRFAKVLRAYKKKKFGEYYDKYKNFEEFQPIKIPQIEIQKIKRVSLKKIPLKTRIKIRKEIEKTFKFIEEKKGFVDKEKFKEYLIAYFGENLGKQIFYEALNEMIYEPEEGKLKLVEAVDFDKRLEKSIEN